MKTPIPSLAAATLLLVALAACSSDPTAAPANTPGSPEPAEASPTARFDFSSSATLSIDCTAFDDYVQFDQLSVDHDVELVSLTAPDAVRTSVGRSWISDDPEQLGSGGLNAVRAGGVQVTDEPGWSDKTPVKGYKMVADTDYTVFTELSIRPGAVMKDLIITYLLDGAEITTVWPTSITRKQRCP